QPGPYRLTVLTDTTERSPTFTFAPFEREGCQEPPSLCYLSIPEAGDAAEAWRQILRRDPRPLEWGTRTDLTGAAALRAFDFSAQALAKRQARTGGRPHHLFTLERTATSIVWHFRENRHALEVPPGIDLLGENLLLKMLLNIHSTLVAGRL